jgi:hypothetical protein
MGHKSYLEVGGFKRGDVPVENNRPRATHNPRSEID